MIEAFDEIYQVFQSHQEERDLMNLKDLETLLSENKSQIDQMNKFMNQAIKAQNRYKKEIERIKTAKIRTLKVEEKLNVALNSSIRNFHRVYRIEDSSIF